jgi:hypothetical protein
MKTEGSLPCLQEHNNDPFLEPAESSQDPHTLLLLYKVKFVPVLN